MEFDKIDNIAMGGVDTADYPDFADAYIESADYKGVEATEEELDIMNADSDFVYESLQDWLF
tara:strand:+ start:1158 stop:1343 length:186 start_codon:yes stop_codon:yes gene_type:complete